MANTKELTLSQKIQKLKLFNSKVDVFRRSRFVQQTFGPGNELGVTVKLGGQQPWMITKRGPDEDAVLALVTSLRFFVQERDGIKLDQIAKIYEDLPVEDMAKQSARSAVDSVNLYLDKPCEFVFDNQVLTNRQIFETFMYGSLAHANDDKREVYETWRQGPFALIFQLLFEDIAAQLVSTASSFYCMNERTIQLLQQLASKTSAG